MELRLHGPPKAPRLGVDKADNDGIDELNTGDPVALIKQLKLDDARLMDIDENNLSSLYKKVANLCGHPTPVLITLKEVKLKSSALSKSIFQNWRLLNSILQRHEAVIQKRWRKRSVEQRRKVLLSAWDGPMPSNHRPDFEAFHKETNAQRRSGTRHRDAFVWPYINQEDLTKPRTLLLFLNSRGRHGPDKFASADVNAMHLGMAADAVSPAFLHGYIMLFRGRDDAESYGEIVKIDEHRHGIELLFTQKEPHAGLGLLILEIQDRIIAFLLKCARDILFDFSDTQVFDSEVRLEPPSASELGSGFTSLAILAAEAPYRVPYQLDMPRIESLLAAKRDQAADHLWSLREDPKYFMHAINEVAEHQVEQLNSSRGRSHAFSRQEQQDFLWEDAVSTVLTTSYLELETWSELESQARSLGTMYLKYGPTLRVQDDLPADFYYAILTFRYWLDKTAQVHVLTLKPTIAGSALFRPYVEGQPATAPTTPGRHARQKLNVKLDKLPKEVLWLLGVLWGEEPELRSIPKTIVVDELQRLLSTSDYADELISEYVAALIADISIISECMNQIDLFQPWANTYQCGLQRHGENLRKDFAKSIQVSMRLLDAFCGDDASSLVRFMAPGEVDFHYPVDKRRTKQHVEAMQMAEKNLDRFWARVDDITKRKVGNLNGTATGALLKGSRTLSRTADWIEPVKSAVMTNVLTEFERPLSELYLELQRRTERTITRSAISAQAKAKRKTRGAVNLPSTTAGYSPPPEASADDAQPAFKVGARALRVFKNLFHTPSLTAAPGEIDWADFLHALASIGFGAEKLYGSVWQFNPTRIDVDRAIQFHEPHPSGKIPFFAARRHGRRLNRAYGWHGGMFVLAEKT
ncbi:uncharacterized protein AB675_8031 [Cyphellophora attinorum]|uniref:Uncharacterized protein n=1 Tax=Cyphellophora attinorum TaxID=1664694 RepID=A0A0N0NN69_9EURO|nr:uncharacterized protein AB675_8031 [Phialophora attinorum]KPI41029.1 hypothetical protein AB675_8031 [Phialophora attinorum]